jgi:GDP-L-fucose synthase
VNKIDRILITGASGMLGTALRQELRKQDYIDITGCPRIGAGSIDNVFKRYAPDYVFHLAGRVRGIGGNMANQADAFYDNITVNTSVIEACRKFKVKKVIAMGSGAVYHDTIFEACEDDIWLGAPHSSEYGYAQAKRAMLAQLECYNLPYIFAISANLYGPHDNFNLEKGHVIPSLIRKFYEAKRDGKAPVVWGTGTAMRDFMYVDDAARALIKLMESALNGPVNIGSGDPVTIMDVVRHLLKIADIEKYNSWDNTKPDGVKCRQYNLDRLRRTDFKCTYNLATGLKAAYDWFAAHYDEARK